MEGLTIVLWIFAIIGALLLVIDVMYLINNWNVVKNTNAFKKTPIDQVLLKLAYSDSSDYDANMKAIMKVAGSWLRVFRVLKDSKDYKFTQVDSNGNTIVYDLSSFKDKIQPAMSFANKGENNLAIHHTEEPVYNEETGEYTTKINLYNLDSTKSTDSNNKTITTYNAFPVVSPGRMPSDPEKSPNIYIEFFKPVEYSHIKH